jgi:hypothetical protein
VGWNFNMGDAPRGETKMVMRTIGANQVETEQHIPVEIIAAGTNLVVTITRWLPKEGRWNMFSKERPPIAWHIFPKHPEAE